MENKLASFHTSLKIWIPPLFIFSLGFGGVFFLVILKKSESVQEALKFSMILSCVIGGLLSILFVIVNYTYLVTVFTNGISSFDPFGSWKRDFMEWGAMNYIERKNILGVKYYFIQSQDSLSRLWIPVELINKHDFIYHVGENAGKNHPFFVELLNVST